MADDPRRDLFPGYDVLAKRDTVSWNAPTRAVVAERLAIDPDRHRAFDEVEWATLKSLCDRIVPQPADRPGRVPVAAMIDAKVTDGAGDGYRDARMPPLGEAWRRGLAALDAEAKLLKGAAFADLPPDAQDGLIAAMKDGRLRDAAWGDMPCDLFAKSRVMADVVRAYYAHPTAWNEVGFGGPAGPRGYVRLDYGRRDPWEAAEAEPGAEDAARRANARVGR